MPTKRTQLLSILAVTFIILISCSEENKNSPYKLKIPSHFSEGIEIPSRNPLTKAGVLLGEKLFFDPILSGNLKISCATCHIPELAFTDGMTTSSSGASHRRLIRNTPTIVNIAWMKGLFWDGGAKNLESLPFAALTSPDEMGADLSEIAIRLNKNDSYTQLFHTAFNIDSISSAYIARALAQYQRTIIDSDSKFDRHLKTDTLFNSDELKGYEIFKSKCGYCHTPPLFTDNSYHNNGLDSIFPSEDLRIRMGRFRITGDSADIGKYKTPTLRNLAITAPYMHDGRFSTLDEVLDHYQAKIVVTETVDTLLSNMKITNSDKKLIKDFLATLNDSKYNF